MRVEFQGQEAIAAYFLLKLRRAVRCGVRDALPDAARILQSTLPRRVQCVLRKVASEIFSRCGMPPVRRFAAPPVVRGPKKMSYAAAYRLLFASWPGRRPLLYHFHSLLTI